jgi:pyridoxine 5-phosphate synthase
MMRLGVNIDHAATLRQARRGSEPQPVLAAMLAEAAGADAIVAHLREDRRHIHDRDVLLLKKAVRSRFNLEMSVAREIVGIACRVKPDQATFVPEKRQELTTEGGLDVCGNLKKISAARERLEKAGTEVSLFIDPEKKQIDAAVRAGARMVELHTGRYAGTKGGRARERFRAQIGQAALYARKRGLLVFAGHGLDYYNVSAIARIKEIEELNIGYAIICRAVMVGMERAVKEMKALISQVSTDEKRQD